MNESKKSRSDVTASPVARTRGGHRTSATRVAGGLLALAAGALAALPAVAQKVKVDPIAYTDQKVGEEAALRSAGDQALTQKLSEEAAARTSADQALSTAQIALRADVDALASSGGGLRVYDATGRALGTVVTEGLLAMRANDLLLPIAIVQDPTSAKGAAFRRFELKQLGAAISYESTDCTGQGYMPMVSASAGLSSVTTGIRAYVGFTSAAAVYAAPGGAAGTFRAYVSTNTTAVTLAVHSYLEPSGCVSLGTSFLAVQGFPVTSVYDFTATEPLTVR